MSDSLYVQYGCGFSSYSGWRNFDASPTLWFERIPLIGRLYSKNSERFPDDVEFGNIVDGLPIPNESCDGVYCSHILEHLSLQDFRAALRETKRILKTHGTFRLIVPDLEYDIRRYLQSTEPQAAIKFMRDTCLGVESRKRGLGGLLTTWLGNSAHLWMWDYKSLELELIEAGFREVRRAKIGDSKDLKFLEVESPERWLNCLGVECLK